MIILNIVLRLRNIRPLKKIIYLLRLKTKEITSNETFKGFVNLCSDSPLSENWGMIISSDRAPRPAPLLPTCKDK